MTISKGAVLLVLPLPRLRSVVGPAVLLAILFWVLPDVAAAQSAGSEVGPPLYEPGQLFEQSNLELGIDADRAYDRGQGQLWGGAIMMTVMGAVGGIIMTYSAVRLANPPENDSVYAGYLGLPIALGGAAIIVGAVVGGIRIRRGRRLMEEAEASRASVAVIVGPRFNGIRLDF